MVCDRVLKALVAHVARGADEFGVTSCNGLVALITKFGSSGASDSSVTPERFTQYSMITFAVAVVFVFVAMAYRYKDVGEARK